MGVPLGLPAVLGQATAQLEIWHPGLFFLMGSQHTGEKGAREIPVPATEQCQPHQVADGLIQLHSQYLEGWRCHGHRSMGPLGPGAVFVHP